MNMFKKYQLTDMFWLEICFKDDAGALNGDDFIAEKDWAIEKEGDGFGIRNSYYTTSSKNFNLPMRAENPKTAIQQILSYAYTGRETKLKKMYFKIIKEETKW